MNSQPETESKRRASDLRSMDSNSGHRDSRRRAVRRPPQEQSQRQLLPHAVPSLASEPIVSAFRCSKRVGTDNATTTTTTAPPPPPVILTASCIGTADFAKRASHTGSMLSESAIVAEKRISSRDYQGMNLIVLYAKKIAFVPKTGKASQSCSRNHTGPSTTGIIQRQ